MVKKLRLFLLFSALVVTFGVRSSNSLSAEEILKQVNLDRQKYGLTALAFSPKLNLAAFAKAEDMVSKNYFAHTSPDGRKPWYWFKALGYEYSFAGENLAVGFSNPSELEESWMSSPSHRDNILSPNYSEMGLAVVTRENTTVVVQFFGNQNDSVTLR